MFANTKATNGFAVDDIEAAKQFYGETLGLGVKVLSEEFGVTSIQLAGGRDTLVYAKPDFVPATYTILNFEVDDVDAAVDELASKGVSFERYEGFEQDEKGIARGPGPSIAWFKDPAGNILSVLQQPPSGRRSGGEQLRLLGGELLLGEDPLRLQLAELLELVDRRLPPPAAGGGAAAGGGRLLRFFLLRPALALAARDAVAHRGGGSGDGRRSCDSSVVLAWRSPSLLRMPTRPRRGRRARLG